MDEINNNINEIDLSIDSRFIDDDDDISFGSVKITDKASNNDFDAEDREFNKNTGIMIDLSDTDEDLLPTIKHKKLELTASKVTDLEEDYSDYNEVDMETYISEDDEVYEDTSDEISVDELAFKNDESNRQLDEYLKKPDGEVAKDYWKQPAKKHAASNKKGAYNLHFHLSGNPKLEQELFNKAMTPNTKEANYDGAYEGAGNTSNNIVGTADCGGFGESLNNKTFDNYTKQLKDLLAMMNLEIIINSDNSYTLFDLCDDSSEYLCKDINELKNSLYPYLQDFFIYPFQINTGLKLNSCEDWVNWYNTSASDTLKAKYKNDIAYCDLIANHLDECKIEDLI